MRAWFLISLLVVLGGCASSKVLPDKLVLTPVGFGALPNWGADSGLEPLKAYFKSCEALLKIPIDQPIGTAELSAPAGAWQGPCQIALRRTFEDDPTAKQFFEQQFIPFKAANNLTTAGKFTGYFEPLLKGSRTRSQQFSVPVYAKPQDLTPGTPYYTRAEIYTGVLANRGLEIAWVDDPVGLFFTEIQGSGRIQLDTGEIIRIGFDGKNGHPYTPIGRVLKELGAIPEDKISMQSIQEWLWRNPDKSRGIMEQNTSYIFFREIQGEGPIGAQNVALTPQRSLAIDKAFIPLGTPIYIDTLLPSTPTRPSTFYRRLMIAQDTGGAIKGPVRADIFFGSGQDAEFYAGHLNSGGEYYLLLPRAVAAKLLR